MQYLSINPIIFSVGSWSVRWYSLPYIMGFLLCSYALKNHSKIHKTYSYDQVESICSIGMAGLIVGARIFYLYFYQGLNFDLLQIFHIWEGGMSFHGGFFGFVVAVALYCGNRGIRVSSVTDPLSVYIPVTLFFGRITNYINGELYGRPTSSALGTIFPSDLSQLPRHPSQLYEAFAEGLLCFVITYSLHTYIAKNKVAYRPYLQTAVLLIAYSLARITCEFFREPDQQIGFIFKNVTMGQILTVSFIITGISMLRKAFYCNDKK